MPRYFFDLYNGNGLTRDPDGQEIDKAELAASAVTSIRSILSEEVKEGELDLAGRIEIRDERGAVVLRVPFRSALTLRLDGEQHP